MPKGSQIYLRLSALPPWLLLQSGKWTDCMTAFAATQRLDSLQRSGYWVCNCRSGRKGRREKKPKWEKTTWGRKATVRLNSAVKPSQNSSNFDIPSLLKPFLAWSELTISRGTVGASFMMNLDKLKLELASLQTSANRLLNPYLITLYYRK